MRKNRSAERRLRNQLGTARQRDWGDVWQEAHDWAIANHQPSPSMREHLVSWSLAGCGKISSTALGDEAITVLHSDGTLPMAGQWEIDNAIAHCTPSAVTSQ